MAFDEKWEPWRKDRDLMPHTDWDEEENGVVLWSKGWRWITVKKSDYQGKRFVRLYVQGVLYASCGGFCDIASPEMVDQIIDKTVTAYMEAANQFDKQERLLREALHQ